MKQLMEQLNCLEKYKIEPGIEHLNSIPENRKLLVKNSLLKLGKRFQRELKDREMKIKKKEWETYLLKQYLKQDFKVLCIKKSAPSPKPRKLAHSPINVSVEDMDSFEEKEMMRKRPFTKNIC